MTLMILKYDYDIDDSDDDDDNYDKVIGISTELTEQLCFNLY